MKNIQNSLGNLLFLIKPYWKHAKLYFIGRMTLSIFVAPASALVNVILIQSIVDAIVGGATLSEIITIAAVLVAILFGLEVINWSFLLLYDRWKAKDMRNKINRSIYEQAVATDYKYFDDPEFYNSFTFAVSELATKSESAFQLTTEILHAASIIIAMTAYLFTLSPWVLVIAVAGQIVYFIIQRMLQRIGLKRAMEALPYDRMLSYIHRIAYQKQYAADMKCTSLAQKILAMFDKSGEDMVGVYKRL